MKRSAEQREELIRRYEEGPSRLAAALAKVPQEALQWRPGPEKWSVHEVICHCADSETNAAVRIRHLVCEESPVLVGYDQARWAKLLDYHAMPLEPALETVRAVRAHTAGLLRRMPAQWWSRTGRHTDSGTYSAEQWLDIYAEHLEKHARARSKETSKPGAPRRPTPRSDSDKKPDPSLRPGRPRPSVAVSRGTTRREGR